MPSPPPLLERILQTLSRLPPKAACTLGARCMRKGPRDTPLLLNPCDPVQAETLTQGRREPWFTRALEATIRILRPATVIDVGANIGYYLALYAKTRLHHGYPRRVIAVEPSSRSLSQLAANTLFVRKRGLETKVLPLALGSEDSTAFIEPGETPNLDHIAAPGSSYSTGERVLLARLDTLVGRGVLPCPDLIRMDVEGYEHHVLEGAERTLVECEPILALELHPQSMARYGAVLSSLLEKLENLGYRVVYYEWGPKTPLQTLTPKRAHYVARAVSLEPPSALANSLKEGSMIIAVNTQRRR